MTPSLRLFRLVFLCSFTFFAHQKVIAQSTTLLDSAQIHFDNKDYDTSAELYSKVLTNDMVDSSTYANAILGLSEVHFAKRKYNDAMTGYLQLENEHRSELLSLKKQWLLKARLGFCYRYIKRELKMALEVFEEERLLAEELDTLIDKNAHFANAYNLSTTYRLLENYERALNFGFEALSHIQTAKDPKPRNFILSYSVIANILGDMKDFGRAATYHLKKIELGEELYGVGAPELADFYNNAAVDFFEAREYEQAKTYFLKAQAARDPKSKDERLLATSHRGLASIYQQFDEYQLAKAHLDTALIHSGNAFQKASTLMFLARYYTRVETFDQAIGACQEAFSNSIRGFEWSELSENPSDEELLLDPFHYRILNQKAASWLAKFRATKDQQSLQEAFKCYETMDRVTEVYRNNFSLETSKLFFQEYNYAHYERAIETLHHLYLQTQDESYIEKAWQLIEKNKSLVLIENLIQAESLNTTPIADSLKVALSAASQKRWNIRRDINRCNQNGDCDEANMVNLRAALSQAEDSLTMIRDDIKKQVPDYYETALGTSISSLTDTRQNLPANSVMANFFASNTWYFLITASAEKITFKRINRSDTLENQLETFLRQVSGEKLATDGIDQSYEELIASGVGLYNQLLKPMVEAHQSEEFILIPDGLLSLLPFEALITKKPAYSRVDFAQLDYVVKSHMINYAYSATLWLRNKNRKQLSTRPSLLAFAADQNQNRPDLARLEGTRVESELLRELPNAKVFSEGAASETNFKAECANAQILHLAMHNLNDATNPLNSQLVFNQSTDQEDGSLFMFELYGLQMDPELVVLSACETGVGEWKRGEGPYHIGRGFLYHGNPALIVSLWKVRDQSAAKIMGQLYDAIGDGHNTGTALRNAKLEFLTQADELIAHPSNWAAFIGIGQVSVKSPTNYQWFALLALLIILSFFAQKKLRFRST